MVDTDIVDTGIVDTGEDSRLSERPEQHRDEQSGIVLARDGLKVMVALRSHTPLSIH